MPENENNDSIDVSSLISLSDADITPDLLAQLEDKANAQLLELNNLENPQPVSEYVAPDVTLDESADEQDFSNQEEIDIQQGMPAEGDGIAISQDITEHPNDEVDTNNNTKQVDEKNDLSPIDESRMNAIYKKYVVYIDRQNEEYIDSLSIMERKKIINDVLYEQNRISKEKLREKKQIELFIKIMIVLVTFMISVPLLYIVFNRSLQTTIQNYRTSKSNFEVLYKETGKIKIK